MTIYYVGLGGDNGNDGLSWANRKLTLSGAEDVPISAGDTVYVGPGVYRELLTCDVSGSSGSPITYIGDVTGEHTDGVGGIVRVTGSDDDQSATRGDVILASSRDYRTFRGFMFDTTSSYEVYVTNGSHWIVEDCYLNNGSGILMGFIGTGTDNTVRRCVLFGGTGNGIHFGHTSTVDDTNQLVENCILIGGGNARGINADRIGGVTVKNNLVIGWDRGICQGVAPAAGQAMTVYNNIVMGNQTGLYSPSTDYMTEDYNNLWGNATSRSNVTAGGNSTAYPPLLAPPLLLAGFRFPWLFGELSKWSQLSRIAGTSMSADDIFGVTRPATDSKKSWGAVQWTGAARETSTVHGGSAASLKLPDAGEQFLMRIPVAAESTTISIYCYREADYDATASFLPKMIIKQPGQSDRTTTDTGSASQWNQLSDTFTPSGAPPYVDVFVVSGNVAIAGSYAAYFDTLVVS